MNDTLTSAPLWGITGPNFLWAYGAAAVLAAVAVGWRRWVLRAGGDAAAVDDLGTYELALLSGGPQLAITSAAAQLHEDGLLRIGSDEGTLEVAGELEPHCDPLERAVFETVARQPGMTSEAMRVEVATGELVSGMTAQLTSDGLC